MSYDLKQASENSSGPIEALPGGRYSLEVTKAEFGKSNNNNPKIDVEFVIISDPYRNRRGWTIFTLTDAAMPIFGTFLRACKSDLVEKEDIEGPEIAKNLVGLKCSAYTIPGKTTGGNPRNDWKNWAPIDRNTEDDSESESEDLFEFEK